METYECASCKQTVTVKDEREKPTCCGKSMKKVPYHEVCLQPAHPEHARPMEDEEPCDEGRAGV